MVRCPDMALSGFALDQHRRGLLPRTVEARRVHVACWLRHCGDLGPWKASTAQLQVFLDGRNLSAKARYGWISNLHTFYVWAIREGYARADPTADIPRPRLRRALPRPAVTAELREGLDLAYPALRAWMSLAAYGGLRVQEIAGLRREDILPDEGLLRVVCGKGSRERVIPLHPAIWAALAALPMPRAGWVFLDGEKPWTPVRLAKRFGAGLRDVGVTATPHQLRHWFGSTLYAQTHDLRLVQEMLGHSSPATTAIYTAFDRKAAGVAVQGLDITRKERLA